MAKKTIDIISCQRTRKSIRASWEQGDGKFDLDEPDNPLPAFTKAFDALNPLVGAILGLPESWVTDCRVVGFKMGEQAGAPTVQLMVRRSVSGASKEFAFITPPRLLEHPTEPGAKVDPLSPAHASLVWEADEQGKAYVSGKRAQGQIVFEGEEDDDPEDEDVLPLGEAAAPAAVPGKGKKKKKAAE